MASLVVVDLALEESLALGDVFRLQETVAEGDQEVAVLARQGRGIREGCKQQ